MRLIRTTLIAAALATLVACDRAPEPWTAEELEVIQSLSLDALAPLPPDPTNAVADDPRAADFGEALFFETRFSANGATSCATCHQPVRRFTDGLQKGVAVGISKRHTPSIVGTAYSPWLYWDGRRDSQWSQALSPLEDPNEHGSDRETVVAVVLGDDSYRQQYEALFGEPADTDAVFANIGKAIAAFERTIMPTASRFDEYAAELIAGNESELLSDDEVHGLRLFIGKANCTQCHNGPLFTNNEFHNTGLLNFPGDIPDKGRVDGVREVLVEPFNCRSRFSDDPSSCAELDFALTGAPLIGAFRTPSLRNIADTQPYGHKGQQPTLMAVLEHYNEAPDAMIGHNESKPLELSRRQLHQLEAFLHTLEAPVSYPDSM